MTRTPLIIFSLLLFLCFQAQAQDYSLSFLSNSPMETSTIPTSAGRSGVVDIQKDSQGFYVEADLEYYPFGPRSIRPPPPPEAVKMMVSLSNSETLATKNCLNFSDFDYLKYNWEYLMSDTVVSYPNFNASSMAGFAYIFMDRKYWAITNSKVYLSKSCQSGDNTSLIGSDRYGVLGFGYSSWAKNNFWQSKNFSVYVKPDLSAGKLILNNDTNNYTKALEPAYKLSANSDWNLFNVSGSVGVKNYSAAFNNSNVIFDINSDAIGLPLNLFQSFLGHFAQIPNISCSSALYKPDCNTTGSSQDLPDITLSVNNTQIKIPSKIYASPNNSSNFKLNLKATSPSLSGPSYVTPAFKDSIILDAHFMSYYFTVFDATTNSNVISLYPAATEKVSGPLDGLKLRVKNCIRKFM